MVTGLKRERRQEIWLFLLGGFVLLGSFLLFAEHRAHLLGVLPYLLGSAALFLFLLGRGRARSRRKHDDPHGGAR